MGLSSKRPHGLNYSVNKKGPRSGGKVESAIKHYKMLERKKAFEGENKWISNAFVIVLEKLKKYGINPNKI